MVNGMHFRHPSITASMAVSLDLVSGGRSYLGLGAGWFEPESEAHGLGLGTKKERFDRFEEGLEVIVSLLTNEETDFSGQYYQLKGARNEPKAIQKPHPPIVIGGTGRKRTLRAVARYAQMWDALMAGRDEWKELRQVLEDHCQAEGRDSGEITCSVHVRYKKDDDPSQIADMAAERLADGVDAVVFTMGSPNDASMVEPLAKELAAR